MSFSREVKEELVRSEGEARHCRIAELAAMLVYSRAVRMADGGGCAVEFQSDFPQAAGKCARLFWSVLSPDREAAHDTSPPENVFRYEGEGVEKLLQTIKYTRGDAVVNPLVIKSVCCKRCFLRGVFLSIGSMSNPEKGYHLEFVCENMEQAGQLLDTLNDFSIAAKVVQRKRYQVVYIKESEEIVELLNVMGAHISLMNLENLRILKGVRNSVNRRVNCEAANITKTVNAAAKQIEDIEYIREHYGFDNLSENLREVAQIRLEYPEAALKELGMYLSPRVGKSGVNHRLRKLSELADKLRNGGVR
ncbi:MAG: DNA-binding protein WhiA [Roseburia sp.]|nr:DNA-binding protein WhiA [Roseburia sp.]